MIREELVEYFTNIKDSNRLTYKMIQEITGLNQSQISNILKHNGKSVSIDIIEKSILDLGFIIEVDIYNLDEVGE
jgi:predicted XRE-type DNA-binding protein